MRRYSCTARVGCPPAPGSSVEFGGRGAWVQKRRATVRDLAEYLRDQGSADTDELIEQIPSGEIGYSGSSHFFWEAARDVLEALPGISVESHSDGETWVYDADDAIEAVRTQDDE